MLTATTSTALGFAAAATADNSIALGANSSAANTFAIAIGANSSASKPNSIAIGFSSSAAYSNSMAIGSQAATTRSNQIALGTNTTEVTVPNIAGNADQLISANADGTLQRTNISTSEVASLVSNKASNAFDQSIIQVEVGNTSGSTTSSVSIGAGACAQFAGSTAIGAKAKTTRTNQVVVGNRKTTTTIPNIAGNGNGMVIANSDGTLARSTINLNNLALLTNGSTPMSTGVASNTEGRIQIGKNTTTKGENAVAIGADSKAVGRNAMAVGAGAISLEDNLITIGSEQTKTRITNLSGEGNQIIFGEPKWDINTLHGSQDH